jgi:hypothetical protein
MKKILLTAAVLGAALSVRAESEVKREFPADGIKRIQILAGSGPIEVRAGKKIEVEVVENKKPDLCLLTMEARGGILFLKAENAKVWFVPHEGCGAGFRVSAPAALPLDAMAGSGDIALDGMSGETVLAAGSGNVSGTLSGRLTAKLGSGRLALKGLTSGAVAKTGSGDVSLTWAKASVESVSVKSGSGNVLLVFPAGTKLQANQLSGSGTAVNKLGETPGAPLNVSVKTGSGDSTIQAAD